MKLLNIFVFYILLIPGLKVFFDSLIDLIARLNWSDDKLLPTIQTGNARRYYRFDIVEPPEMNEIILWLIIGLVLIGAALYFRKIQKSKK